MATTSPDNLYSPDNADDWDLIVDLGAMQTSTQAALANRVRHYTATTFSGLPTSGVTSGSSGYTSTDQRYFRYTGSKWVLIGGNTPRANVKLAADTNVGTTYIGLNTTSAGIAVSGNFTIPAGCGGGYAYSIYATVANDAANVFLCPFVNGVSSNKQSLSGVQRSFANTGLLELNAGDVVQFRARTFAGTHVLDNSYTWMSLSFVGSN